MNDKELQIKLGNATEKFICKTLRKFNYWNYNLPKKTNGQPFDIVALKGLNNKLICWCIDGKHVRSKDVSFTFDRIEPNQITSFDYAYNFAKIPGKCLGFAIFFERDKQLYWFPYLQFIDLFKQNKQSVNMHDLILFEELLTNEDNNQQ